MGRRRYDRSPSWSPDGKSILFTRSFIPPQRRDIEIFSIGTGRKGVARQITRSTGINFDPAWSPRGDEIALVSTRIRSTPQIFLMNANGSNATPLTQDALSAGEPAWSPDASRIAFVRDDDIWTMNADGTNPVRLTRSYTYTEAIHPAWSPDGTKIVFSQDVDFGRSVIYALYVIPASGGEPRPLLEGYGNYEDPDWQRLP
jgi:Tol biopolymer transport system component